MEIFLILFLSLFFYWSFFVVTLTPADLWYVPLSVSEIHCTRGFCDEQQQHQILPPLAHVKNLATRLRQLHFFIALDCPIGIISNQLLVWS